jgi:hypothetical protein
MWLNVRAFDRLGQLIYESGIYNPISGILQYDQDLKIYEVKQGLTPELANLLELPAGESFHFVLNNTTIKDNRIPPQGVTQNEYDRPGLKPVEATYASGQYWDETSYNLPPETARVYVTLHYQTSSKEYVDFLRGNGGVDALVLGELWGGLKSSPQVMAIAYDPRYLICLPLTRR